MNLYRVTTLKKHGRYGTIYVVEADPTSAYNRVKEYLDKNDLCFINERELDKVELIAGPPPYPLCESIILLPEVTSESTSTELQLNRFDEVNPALKKKISSIINEIVGELGTDITDHLASKILRTLYLEGMKSI